MFREIREIKENKEERIRREEEEKRQHILKLTGGKHYTKEEVEEAKSYIYSLFGC